MFVNGDDVHIKCCWGSYLLDISARQFNILSLESQGGYPLFDVALIKCFPSAVTNKASTLASDPAHTFNVRAHIGMSLCIHANSCWAVNGSFVFRTVHGLAVVITPFSLSEVGYCGMGPGRCAFSSSSWTMRKSRTVINSLELTRRPVLLLLRIVIAFLAGSFDIKSLIVDFGGKLLNTSKTRSHCIRPDAH